MIRMIKIKDIYVDWFNNATLPEKSNATTDNKKISIGALDFLTEKCGDLMQQITDDQNLNEKLMDQFAQTFIRHFWNSCPGYGDLDTFYIKLRAFFDEQLPIWAEFYREAIVNKGTFITNDGKITVDDSNNLHYIGNSSNNTNNQNNTTVDSNNTTNNITNVNETGKSTGSEDGTDKSTSNTTDSNSKNSSSFNAESDTPQDELSISNITPDKPTNGYSFDYASKVDADWSSEKNNGSQDVTTSNTSNKNNVTDTQNHSETINNSTNKGNTVTTNTGINKGTSNDEHNQTSAGTNLTDRKERNESLVSMAIELNKLANGAYANLFIDAKRYQLFMLIYM